MALLRERGLHKGQHCGIDWPTPSPKPRSILLCLDLRIEERFTFAADRMYYDVRSYDPRVFTEPWTAHIEFRKRAEPVDEPWETACYEDERSTQHILGGKAPAK